MLDAEKIELVRAMSGEADDSVVSAYLAMAGNRICRRAYPFDTSVHEVPEAYIMLQIEIAVYLLNKRGNEGLLAHSENGYSDTFESGDVPDSMLRLIVPMCGTFGGSDGENR